MKKLSLLLFMGGLLLISLTNIDCKRRQIDIAPISGGDTQTVTTVDSTGEDVHVTVYVGNTTSGEPEATGAEVYLFNNFTDVESYLMNGSLSSKYIDSVKESNGEWLFPKVKPPSTTPFPDSIAAYSGDQYQYYVLARWTDNSGQPETGWYSIDAISTDEAPITVQINNGLQNGGLKVALAVNP